MSEKMRRIVMGIAGAYVMYLGGTLIRDIWMDRPEHSVLFMVAGGFFLLAGLAAVLYNIKAYMEESRKEKQKAGEIERDSAKNEGDAAKEKQGDVTEEAAAAEDGKVNEKP